jgi:hypothetical protein
MSDDEDKKEGSPPRRGREVQVEFSFRIRDEQGLILEFDGQATIPGSFVAPKAMGMTQWVGVHNEAAIQKFNGAIRVEAKRRAEEYQKQRENGTWPTDGRDTPPWHLPLHEWTQEQFDRAEEEKRLSDLSARPYDVCAILQNNKADKSSGGVTGL